MDKNAIKKYAVWARRELISRVSQKALQYGITSEKIEDAADSINGKLLTEAEKKQRAALVKRIREDGFEQVMEEVAYTWFNRFCALRFMEVNGYLPTHVRVFSDEENNFKPQILTEAINIHLAGLDLNKVYQLKNDNKTEELYKYLIITQCNALNSVLPRMFQQISDYTELLFPDNLLREGSVIEQLVSQIPEEDWKDAVQIIGWLYQYYNIEPKDKVFEDLKKNIKITKDKIPAATQLFTPDWIVRYMVENSLGRLWIEGHPDSHIRDDWRYYLDEAEQEESVKAKLAVIREQYAKIEPKEIKCIDPCMGSGHILVYMFDVLVQIYNEYGYSSRDAAAAIVVNNLFGLDIDDRAAQLAYFAVMMKARQYDRRFFERGIQPHIYSVPESNNIPSSILRYFAVDDAELKAEVERLIEIFHDAKEYGSLLQMPKINFSRIYEKLDKLIDNGDILQNVIVQSILPLCKVAEILAQKYDVVITNPPYMGGSGMDAKLTEYVKVNFPDEKTDLFACFIEKGLESIKPHGFSCMVTMQSWMFLSSFEKMRKKLLLTKDITNLMHMDNMVMGIAFGTAVSIFRGRKIFGYKGIYNHIKLENIVNDQPEMFPVKGNRFAQVQEDNFSKIPGNPIAYWAGDGLMKLLAPDVTLKDVSCPCLGMRTGDNDRFLRLWYEVDVRKSSVLNLTGHKSKKWIPYNKGGGFRRWYGYNEYLVNWENDGKEIKDNTKIKYGENIGWKISNEKLYFKAGITWGSVTSGTTTFRFYPQGYIFSNCGQAVILDDEAKIPTMLAFLNTNIVKVLLKIISPTIGCESGYVAKLPYSPKTEQRGISDLSKKNVEITKTDWDSFETSWDFKKHPLI